jgi:tyrosyl-tRNA synthetase
MDKIDELLTRGVANIIPSRDELEKVLKSGKKLNIYLGIDPTATKIHLGHAVLLRKLQQFVELGHRVTFLIGDFTALIGDTSDKDSERPVLTYEQIQENFQTYKSQAEKILDFSKITVRHNSEWLKKLNFEEILKLTRHFSLNDFISRELIKKRLAEGKSVSLPEVLYPVMQGYDSYFMDTDLQIGGTDQTFNMQAGRTLQKDLRNKESFIMSNPFLTGTDGRKMSKSWGNAIWLDDSPNDMYGKVMSIKDDLIQEYFVLGTSLSMSNIQSSMSNQNPMDQKKSLAFQVVSELHNETKAKSAQEYFESTFQQKIIPSNIQEFELTKTSSILVALVDTGLAKSGAESRRLIRQNGVRINGETMNLESYEPKSGDVISVGSRKFIKLK